MRFVRNVFYNDLIWTFTSGLTPKKNDTNVSIVTNVFQLNLTLTFTSGLTPKRKHDTCASMVRNVFRCNLIWIFTLGLFTSVPSPWGGGALPEKWDTSILVSGPEDWGRGYSNMGWTGVCYSTLETPTHFKCHFGRRNFPNYTKKNQFCMWKLHFL